MLIDVTKTVTSCISYSKRPFHSYEYRFVI